jgi:S1-C subfamily serine protease
MSSRSLTAVLCAVALFASRGAGALTITVVIDKAPVTVGSKTITVPKGETYVVEKTMGGFYGIRVKVGGDTVLGWIPNSYCEVKKEAPKTADALEAEAEKDFEKRKAEADKLAAEGKLDAAINVLDEFPNKYWKTKVRKKVIDYTVELEKRGTTKPETVDADAEREFQRRKAEADKLFAEGKIDEATKVLETFPGRFEASKWAAEAKKYAAELAQHAHAPLAELEKKILELVQSGKFDDALAELKALEDKKVPVKASYLKATKDFIDLAKRAAADPKGAASSDPLAADVHAADPEFKKLFMLDLDLLKRGTSLLPLVFPGDAAELSINPAQPGEKIPILKPADRVLRCEPHARSFPWSPNVRMALARLHARGDQVDKAVERYAEARALDRGRTILSLDAAIEAARVLVRAKRAAEAVGLLKKSLDRKADDFIALAALGAAHAAAGAKAEAVAAFEKSLQINPYQPAVRRQLAEAKGQAAPDLAPTKLELTDLVKQVEESCVVVTAGASSGSGYVVGSDGLVATNFHVVGPGLAAAPPQGAPPGPQPPAKIQLRCKRKGEFINVPDAQLVLGDPLSDIALLKIDARAFPLHPVPLASAKDVSAGEDVVVTGNPGVGGQILDYTITKGIISNRDRVYDNVHFFQTDAAVNPGNSGGPMFNLRGQVIGMVTRKAFIEGAGFALHIDQVKAHLPRCFPQSE